MQLSLEKLQSLSEADLRRKVLIPLFRTMGFRDVTELHGSRELGKDIVMWKEDPFRSRINYAAVVKAQKVTTGTQSATVCRQVRESFGSSYTDPVSLAERDIQRVIVVNSKKFTGEARDSIRSELKSSGLEGTTDLVGGEKLFEMIREYLTEAVLWDSLQKASKALGEGSENWDFTLQVGPDGIPSLFVSERHSEAQAREPIRGSLTPRFPPTPEGMQKRMEYQKHFETGTPVELTAENIESFEISEFIRSLVPDGTVTTVILAPTALTETMISRLMVLDQAGRVLYSLDYIHFTHRQGGTKEFSLDNRGQPIPFRLRLAFDKETGKNTFHLNFETEGANVLQYLRWLLLQKAASVGYRIVLMDWNTGLIELGAEASSLNIVAPPDELLALAEQLVFIQDNAHVEMSLGDEDRFSAQDVANGELAARIMSTGKAQLTSGRFSFSIDNPMTIEGTVGEKVSFPVLENDFALEILGSRIPLGKAHILCRGILRKVETPDSEHQFFVDAVEGEPFLAAFPRWLQRGEDQSDSPNASSVEAHNTDPQADG
jgi:hypothetical protein